VGQAAAITAFDHKVLSWSVQAAGGKVSGVVFWLGKSESFSLILNVQILSFSFFVGDVFRFFVLLHTPFVRRSGVFFSNPSFFPVTYTAPARLHDSTFLYYMGLNISELSESN